MFIVMFGQLGAFWGTTWRARLGALGLHLLVGIILLSVEIAPLPSESVDVVSIVLVDAPAPEAVVPEPVPVPEETPPTPEVLPDPELRDELEPSSSEPAQQVSEHPATAPIAIAPISPPSPEPPVPEFEDDEEEPINPAYIIRRDPFAEIAPSGAARVSASVMCARTNRETRPAFCPEIDDEDIRFAQLAREQGDLGGYSPTGDTLFARSTFNRFATGDGYQRFRERQQSLDEFASTGASPVRQLGVNTRRHAEALQNCTPVRTGIARVGGGTDGLSTELTNGSDVFCD